MFQKVFLRLIQARRFRSGMIVLCAIGTIVLTAVGPSPLLANPGTVTMHVDPATRAAPVNGTFTVDIVADVTDMDPNGLGAYDFDLAFDPSVVRVDGVVNGNLLGSTGRGVFAEPAFCGEDPDNGEIVCSGTANSRIDNEEGLVSFAAFSVGHDPGATEVGTLAVITFTARSAGVTALNLIDEAEAAGNPDWDSYCTLVDTHTQANAWPDEGAGRYLDVSDAMVWNITSAFFRKTDFDGDGTDDVAVWDPDPDKVFFKWLGSQQGFKRVQLGPPEGVPLVGDFDGDGKADPAVWIPLPNGSGRLKRLEGPDHDVLQIMTLGPAQGVPLVGDFDGDGRDDPGIWVPVPPTGLFKWFEGENHDVERRITLGPSYAIPVVGDFDGDGRDDPGTWVPVSNPPTARFKWLEGANHDSLQFRVIGPSHAIPMVGDFDGDGRDDPATWVPVSTPPTGRFKWLEGSNHDSLQFRIIGPSNAIPIASDFDGDGRDDPGTWVPSTYRFKWFEGPNHDVFNWRPFGPSTTVPLN
jgi:hypothetical protein